MATVKVNQAGNGRITEAKPKIIRAARAVTRDPVVEYEPDLVRVRAIARGYYAVREVMKDPRTGRKEIVRNDVIRNEGDVFDMDTGDMRRTPLEEIPPGALGTLDGRLVAVERPHAAQYGAVVEIETERGTFELPSWVTLADEAGVEITEPTGHKTTFGKKDNEML